MTIVLILTIAAAGIPALFWRAGLRRNFWQQFPATLADWVWAAVTSGTLAFGALFALGDAGWGAALGGLIVGALLARVLAVTACAPRRLSWISSLADARGGLVVAGIAAVGCLLTMVHFGTLGGLLTGAALVTANAVLEATRGRAQERLLAPLASPLMAVLGVTEAGLLESRPWVDADGTVTIRHPQPSTLTRLGRLDELTAEIMPSHEVAEASSGRIVLRPASAETTLQRGHLASTGGLVAGQAAPAPIPTAITLDTWEG